eukprot:6874026-Prymnesium_polylepis.1
MSRSSIAAAVAGGDRWSATGWTSSRACCKEGGWPTNAVRDQVGSLRLRIVGGKRYWSLAPRTSLLGEEG